MLALLKHTVAAMLRVSRFIPSLSAITFAAAILLAVPSSAHAVGFTATDAVYSDGPLSFSGTRLPEVHWGGVNAKGPVVVDLQFDVLGKTLGARAKAFSAGVDGPSTGDQESWVRWRTTDELQMFHSMPTPIFPPAIDGTPVVDFFSQVMNGSFPGWTGANTSLSGYYFLSTVGSGEGILFDPPVAGEYTTGTGALVQNWPAAGTAVDDMIATQLNYDYWKQYAIDHNTYLRPVVNGLNNVTGYTDAGGHKIYVTSARALTTSSLSVPGIENTTLTQLGQISRKQEVVEASGNTRFISDRLLFIDTIQGTEAGTSADIFIGHLDEFYWKGIVYIAGNLQMIGTGGSPDIRMQNPYEFLTDPHVTSSYSMRPCIIDGVLYVRDAMDFTGSAALYGAFVSGSGSITNMPEVYYDSRLKRGILGACTITSIASGNWHDWTTWDRAETPMPGDHVIIDRFHSVYSWPVKHCGPVTVKGLLDLTGSEMIASDCVIRNEGTIFLENGSLALSGVSALHNADTFPPAQIYCGPGDATSATIAFTDGSHVLTCASTAEPLVMPTVIFNNSNADISAADLTVTGRATVSGTSSIIGQISYAPDADLHYDGALTISSGEWAAGFPVGFGAPHHVFADGSVVWLPASHLPLITTILTIQEGSWLNSLCEVSLTELINHGSYRETTTTLSPNPLIFTNTGTIYNTQFATPGSALDFGLTGVGIQVQSVSEPTTITVARIDQNHPEAPAGIQTGLFWDIQSRGDQTGYVVDVTLPHDNRTEPYACRYTDVNQDWVPARTTWDADSVTLNGVTTFSAWAVGDSSLGAVPVTLSTFSAD